MYLCLLGWVGEGGRWLVDVVHSQVHEWTAKSGWMSDSVVF